MTRRKLLVLVMLVAAAWPVAASELEVKARIEPPGPYHVGDRLRFVWDVQHDAKVKLDADLATPLAMALKDGGFEAADVPASATTTGSEDVAAVPRVEPSPAAAPPGSVHTVLSAPVTLFTTGVHRVAGVAIAYHDAAGAAQKAQTPEMVVPVASVLTSSKAEPHDVKAPVPYPFVFQLPAWAWGLIIAFVGLIGWLILRRRPVKAVVIPPPPPADVEAFTRIDALLGEHLIKEGHIKEFCDRLSDILRHYLGRRFGLASMGETSYELITALEEGNQMAGPDRDQLSGFLESCDLAKFAKARPDEAQLLGLVDAARGLVGRTKPVLATPATQKVQAPASPLAETQKAATTKPTNTKPTDGGAPK